MNNINETALLLVWMRSGFSVIRCAVRACQISVWCVFSLNFGTTFISYRNELLFLFDFLFFSNLWSTFSRWTATDIGYSVSSLAEFCFWKISHFSNIYFVQWEPVNHPAHWYERNFSIQSSHHIPTTKRVHNFTKPKEYRYVTSSWRTPYAITKCYVMRAKSHR